MAIATHIGHTHVFRIISACILSIVRFPAVAAARTIDTTLATFQTWLRRNPTILTAAAPQRTPLSQTSQVNQAAQQLALSRGNPNSRDHHPIIHNPRPLWHRISMGIFTAILAISEGGLAIIPKSVIAAPIVDSRAPIVFRPVIELSLKGVLPTGTIAIEADNSYRNSPDALNIGNLNLTINQGGSLTNSALIFAGTNLNLNVDGACPVHCGRIIKHSPNRRFFKNLIAKLAIKF